MGTINITEKCALVATIDPASLSAATHSTDVIDMKNFGRVVFVITTGVLGTSATVDFEVNGDTASGGSFTTAVTGKAITQIVKASGDNKQVLVEVTADEAQAQGFSYLRGDVTVGTAASIVGVTALAFEPNYFPASDNDLASVAEIVAPSL